MHKFNNPWWMHDAPKRLQHPASTIAINRTTIPHDETWPYITFLYEKLGEPRNRLESRLKDRYEHCYEQSKSLGLTDAQWIGCGEHKQVFALENTVPPRVIKLFCEPGEWQREKRTYDRHDCKKHYLLPHEYYQYYAVCDRIEEVDTMPVEQANFMALKRIIEQGKIHNTKFAKKILKTRLTNTLYLGNFGFHQDMLVWIDIGDYVPL